MKLCGQASVSLMWVKCQLSYLIEPTANHKLTMQWWTLNVNIIFFSIVWVSWYNTCWWVRVTGPISFAQCGVLLCPLRCQHTHDVRFVFVGCVMSYLPYSCLIAYYGVQVISCCVFALPFFCLVKMKVKFENVWEQPDALTWMHALILLYKLKVHLPALRPIENYTTYKTVR